jgi:hypothetical protein
MTLNGSEFAAALVCSINEQDSARRSVAALIAAGAA